MVTHREEGGGRGARELKRLEIPAVGGGEEREEERSGRRRGGL